MLWAIFLALGIIAGQFFPNQFRERVRALAGKARDAAFGVAPAPAQRQGNLAPTPAQSEAMGNLTGNPIGSTIEVRPSPPNKPINWSRAFANLAGFLWRWKWAILVLIFFSLAVGLMRGCAVPFDFAKSRDTLRAERDAERINSAVAKNERDVAAFALEIAERTHARTNAANQAVIEGQQELADVVANLPPMVGQEHFADLQRRYADAYERVLRAAGFEGEPDPSPPRSEPMRRTLADPI